MRMSKLELRGAIMLLVDAMKNGAEMFETPQGEFVEAVPIELLQETIKQITEEAGLKWR